MNIQVEHHKINNLLELSESVTDEVARFCICWKQSLDRLLGKDNRLDIYRKSYGYDVRYKSHCEGKKWFFQIELFYPNHGFNQQISYIKINRFITLPTNQGNGQKVFNQLMICCAQLESLEMIRLRSVRNAISFWLRQNFREQSEQIHWVNGDSIDYDYQCNKRPKTLMKCQYIYDFKKCDCPSCKKAY